MPISKAVECSTCLPIVYKPVDLKGRQFVDGGIRSTTNVDIAVEKGLNWPMGPFRLGDFSGLDVTYNARLHMYRSTGDERYRPSQQLEAKVNAGKLGRKTGEGWYRYEK